MGRRLEIGEEMGAFFLEADFGHYRNKFDGFEGEVLFGSNPFESGECFGHGRFRQPRGQYPHGKEVWLLSWWRSGLRCPKIEIDLGSLGVSEKEEILSYQLLAEFYHQVTERFLLGVAVPVD